MKKDIKMEKFLVEVSIPWEGNAFILAFGLKTAIEYFEHHGDYQTGEIRHLLNYISENYEGAELRDLRTRGAKVIASLAFSDEEQFADFCQKHS